jgi:hypothetical protein
MTPLGVTRRGRTLRARTLTAGSLLIDSYRFSGVIRPVAARAV